MTKTRSKFQHRLSGLGICPLQQLLSACRPPGRSNFFPAAANTSCPVAFFKFGVAVAIALTSSEDTLTLPEVQSGNYEIAHRAEGKGNSEIIVS
jgi:hypothetical protein